LLFDKIYIIATKEVLMTRDDFKRWSKIANIVASTFIPLIVLSAYLFHGVFNITDSDIVDSVPALYLLVLFANGVLTLGTLIYMIAKKQKDLLNRFFWMLANQFFLFFAFLIYIIVGLSEIW